MTPILVRNERTKLLATALNNVSVAVIVAGVIAPVIGYSYGTFAVDDPLRLLSLAIICLTTGGTLMLAARYVLGGLE